MLVVSSAAGISIHYELHCPEYLILFSSSLSHETGRGAEDEKNCIKYLKGCEKILDKDREAGKLNLLLLFSSEDIFFSYLRFLTLISCM